jgi:hypothetical protein
MDHETTRELLELAAVEPGGLERLMAGDTAAAQAVAAHLAGCPACADELARLQRAATAIRRTVRDLPPAELRDRTLAFVHATGIPRGATGAWAIPSVVGVPASPRPAARPVAGALGWVAAIAAAITLSVVATTTIVGSQVDARLATQADTIQALQSVTIATLQVTAEDDARRVSLAGAASDLEGELVFSPSSTELVIIATGLTEPPAGQEYRCWVEKAGDRERVGKMFFSDDLAYWVGPVPAVQDLAGDARFGVTLVSLDGSTEGIDVMEGGL